MKMLKSENKEEIFKVEKEKWHHLQGIINKINNWFHIVYHRGQRQ